MKNKPQSIRIFLLDGIPDGVRTAEIMMSTIEAIAFKRSLLSRVKSELSLSRPGVYLLVADLPEEGSKKTVYVGETEDLQERLTTHDNDSKKDFWVETVVFTSKDENLTKGHVRYVEAELIKLAKQNANWSVPNKTDPKSIKMLPRADRTAMDEFVAQVKIITGTFGFDIFKALPETSGKIDMALATATEQSPLFEMKGDGYQASGVHSSGTGEFIVKAGSQARKEANPSLPVGSKKLREDLLNNGVLSLTATGLQFVQDCSFSSPSSAANVVSGSPTNGRTSWKTADKITYAGYLASKNKVIEQKLLEIGAEGGAITLWGIASEDIKQFRVEVFDGSMVMIGEGGDATCRQSTFDKWEDAISYLPECWVKLLPVFVDENYWPLICKELMAKGVDAASDENWLHALAESRKK